jgi:hypothetical protein
MVPYVEREVPMRAYIEVVVAIIGLLSIFVAIVNFGA